MTFIAGALAIVSFTQPFTANQQAPFTGKYWILESSTVKPAADLDMDGKLDNDIHTLLPECDKDDAEMYRTDGKIVTHHGRNKCDEDEKPEAVTGTWKYNAATRQITSHHYDTGEPQTITLKEISGTRMVVTYEYNAGKSKHLVTAVFKSK